jgi:ribosome-binding protein aMBF1 (putative translation factor)
MTDRTARPVSFAEVIEVLDDLPALLRGARRQRGGLSLRQAAQESGVSLNTLWRIERGVGNIAVTNARALLVWLDGSAVKP